MKLFTHVLENRIPASHVVFCVSCEGGQFVQGAAFIQRRAWVSRVDSKIRNSERKSGAPAATKLDFVARMQTSLTVMC
jgi:hypothetical protein